MVVSRYTDCVGRHVHSAIVLGVSTLQANNLRPLNLKARVDPRVPSVGIMVVKLHRERVLFGTPVLPRHRHSITLHTRILFIYI